ncbi:MAG: hypothetical protein ABF261_07040 [Candidatus Arcticimaribacter sp.]|jgi:hypothetical protein
MFYQNKFYNKYNKNIYSQNGEDGIIEELFNRLNIKNGWVCEFGATNGIHFSNTFNLVKKGFNSVMIEGDAKRYQSLLKTAKNHKNIIPINSYIGYEENLLDDILQQVEIPKDFDLLSIDIDSYDYYVWKSIEKYSPKLVVIEINSTVNPYNENWIYTPKTKYTTTAFRPMLNLGIEKGYKFVLHTGNMIFARNDVFDNLDIHYDNALENFRTKWLSQGTMNSLRKK